MTTRRRFLSAAAGAAALPFRSYAGERRPNIVLILTDDQGWWDVGFHGNRDIDTPVMDRLASEGVSFSRFYASPVCAPTRASLMTGRYHLRTGVYNTRFGGDTLLARETTMAEILRRRGYRTGIFGKWHLGRYARYSPGNRGFDDVLTFTQGHLERYFHPDQLTCNGRPVDARGYITDILTDSAINFLRANRERPFFLYLPFNVPHSPNIVPPEYLEKYLKRGLSLRDAGIYAMVEQCDWNIGRLLAAIDSERLRDNTIVIFMGDNGGTSRHFTAGLRGFKGTAFEGGVRTPFIARWPGRFPAGARIDAMAAHIDLLPTLSEITGAPLPDDRVIDGRSILPLLANGRGDSPHEYIYHIWDRFYPRTDTQCGMSGVRYKLAHNQVFDLSVDPGERNDLSASRPELAASMKAEYQRWFNDVTCGMTYEPVPIEVGRPDENPVELQGSWAHIEEGRAKYTFTGYDWDIIDNWKAPGDSASWKIDVVQPGTYEVRVSYGANPDQAGGRYRISAAGASLEAVVRPTPDRNVFRQDTAGTLELKKGRTVLEIKAVAVPAGDLMSLNRLWLRRL